ncbi:hypothetical protein [Polymorphospora sp. NPDC050346]|uniref:hypothetical protein n=1 Tax=Polymorphospora sp. NPDC050346 TaxID=3155780 RepID=UPI0034116479
MIDEHPKVSYRPPAWMGRLLIRLLLPRRTPLGGRWQTMDQLRDEYAASVLQDADHDPVLDRLLDDAAARFAAELRFDTRPLYLHAVAYANGLIDGASETPERMAEVRRRLPDTDRERAPLVPPYRNYSPHMLTIAALCRLCDSRAAWDRSTQPHSH